MFDGGSPQYAGAAFDGRFVYFIPTVAGFATVTRYDTLSTFTADCAWSTFDLTQLDGGRSKNANFSGAIFDGQYLYLTPEGGLVYARFKAKNPSAMPNLPAMFHGSFP